MDERTHVTVLALAGAVSALVEDSAVSSVSPSQRSNVALSSGEYSTVSESAAPQFGQVPCSRPVFG
ncbi:hypothetical protein ABG874_08370 [Bifidobacterium pseudocatenulatum]|uniref:hypothetical protein n=1 Tax=Bifidobacterium pseudocatenulatum TaxID=28026 RepID=UPI00232BF520|nr:hypothetical protein [Bifidobacterium pseudocatenulatum]MDB6508400.1 hypothetical protein [Bifidobacterium pseudocatenulatum]